MHTLMWHFSHVPSRLRSSSSAARRLNCPLRLRKGLRFMTIDHRNRISGFWTPTGGITPASAAEEDSHALLVRAGYLRQAHSGIFHLLPLGLRVQEKLERLIDKHMRRLGASKVALSSISSHELWRKSGRLETGISELFRFRDRKESRFLLSPTHEEEITTLVAGIAQSYKELPLRLYQISRKYRDERRPRQGLLRAREFVMKDLYTFDYARDLALETYNGVRKVYSDFFDEFKLPYLVAEADSGNMGGNLSHEYHFPNANGEDNVISCDSCTYVANEELAESRIFKETNDDKLVTWTFQESTVGASNDLETSIQVRAKEVYETEPDPFHVEVVTWTGITRDRLSLVNAFFPSLSSSQRRLPKKSVRNNEVNLHAVKSIVPSLDASVENPIELWRTHFKQRAQEINITADGDTAYSNIINLFDYRLPSMFSGSTFSNHADFPLSAHLSAYFDKHIPTTSVTHHPKNANPLDLLRIKGGDACPRCTSGRLKVQRAVELGHTFFLGARYSTPLGASVITPSDYVSETDGSEANIDATSDTPQSSIPSGEALMQMGCHGIGVSRMIGAIADTLADEKGLNWPRVIAPYEVIILPNKGFEDDAAEIYDILATYEGPGEDTPLSIEQLGKFASIDVILDDRPKELAWKLKDADLIGFPVLVVLGRAWRSERKCEIQCRRLGGLRTEVSVEELPAFVSSLLAKM